MDIGNPALFILFFSFNSFFFFFLPFVMSDNILENSVIVFNTPTRREKKKFFRNLREYFEILINRYGKKIRSADCAVEGCGFRS